jgi:hypothetical protein
MPGPATLPASDALAGHRHAVPIPWRMVAAGSAIADFPHHGSSGCADYRRAPLARIRRGAQRTGGAISTSMEDRAPNTDTGEPETSAYALLDELVRALARQMAERDYEGLRYETRSTRRPAGGKKDSR